MNLTKINKLYEKMENGKELSVVEIKEIVDAFNESVRKFLTDPNHDKIVNINNDLINQQLNKKSLFETDEKIVWLKLFAASQANAKNLAQLHRHAKHQIMWACGSDPNNKKELFDKFLRGEDICP